MQTFYFQKKKCCLGPLCAVAQGKACGEWANYSKNPDILPNSNPRGKDRGVYVQDSVLQNPELALTTNQETYVSRGNKAMNYRFFEQ